MYEYDFVRVEAVYRQGRPDGAAYEHETHRRAAQGWRLVQVLLEQPAAVTTGYVLIFERPVA